MLKPIIAGFVTLHFQDAVLFALVFAGAAFTWDLLVVETPGTSRMSGGEMAIWWALWAGGLLVALAVRFVTRRVRNSFHLMGQLDMSVRHLVMSSVIYVVLTWYRVTIEDPAGALASRFAVGAVLSLLAVLMLLFAMEAVDFYVTERRPTEFNVFTSRSVEAALTIGAIIFIDLLIFMDGWAIVAAFSVAMVTFVAGGYAVKVLANAPPRARRLFY